MTASLAVAVDWKPVTLDLLALKEPKIDANADAEAIFWEAWVQDKLSSGAYGDHKVENYKRIKLYNDRGVKKFGNVEIPYFSEMKMTLSDIRARTIKADGSIVEVKGAEIFDATLSKTGKSKIRAKSFAFPALEPGVIVEYQYTENYSEYLPQYMKLPMQLEVPAWEVRYFVRPLSSPYFPYQMRGYPFNCNPSAWEPLEGMANRQGFVWTRVNKVPALIEEPRMPSEDDVKAWMLIYYTETSEEKPEKYWKSLGRKINDEFRRDVKSGGDIKALAAELTAKETGAFSKATALSVYCQTKIRNVHYNAEGIANEDRDNYWKKLHKPEYNANDVLKNKIGTSRDIIALFFSLAQAAGLSPIYVKAGSANGAIFRADFLDRFLLRNSLVAIKVGEGYEYFNPGIPYLPPGMTDWDEQGQAALLADSKEPQLLQIPPTPAQYSEKRRSAKLKLSAEGLLEGTARIEYFGHFAVAQKRDLDNQSAGSREETLKKGIEEQYPGARISKLAIENANSPMGILAVSFDIAMEGYGQRTGKRLFFQPGFFQFGERPLFSASTRKYPITFQHGFLEADDVTIELPETYDLENAEIPAGSKLGEIGEYKVTATVSQDRRTLRVVRKFHWGNKGGVYFEAKNYEPLKKAWDVIHDMNNHSLTLRAKAQ